LPSYRRNKWFRGGAFSAYGKSPISMVKRHRGTLAELLGHDTCELIAEGMLISDKARLAGSRGAACARAKQWPP
jgi:hypothetical protein